LLSSFNKEANPYFLGWQKVCKNQPGGSVNVTYFPHFGNLALRDSAKLQTVLGSILPKHCQQISFLKAWNDKKAYAGDPSKLWAFTVTHDLGVR
jgi:hypothetical protein